MSLDFLYPQVSEAIRRAEILEDRGDPGASSAYLDVSHIEERIAEALPASDPEGAVARRGAVRAALAAKDLPRAQHLVEKFLAEAGDNAELRADLLKLKVSLRRELASIRPDDLHCHQLAVTLNDLSFCLNDIGRREDALAASQEAVAIWQQLATARPEAFESLASALNILSARLEALGRGREAVAVGKRAIAIRRQLAMRHEAF
jgi:tetratricopeptide (TPR) repeat protein